MNAQKNKFTWTAAGLLLALTAGAPAVADDTELMLVTPDVGAKPNILFILDTSGSMDEEVRTQEPYDSGETYGGDCNTDSVYWTEIDLPPDCDATPAQEISKSAFVCDAAGGQLIGIGSYSGTMVQHRETATPDVFRWQELEPGNTDDLVECQDDAGEHGESAGSANVWAANAAGDPFTDDPNQELAWGSAPASVTYTVYDGNYLNWKDSPETVDMAKIDILKSVSTAVLNSVSDVNVGIMRFQGNDGGTVIKAVSDLDADRQSLLDTIDAIDAGGNTPLSETMLEAALYWRSQAAYYGENWGPSRTDPDALASSDPMVYDAPQTNMCSKNFNVLLSDGLPVDDRETPELLDRLAGFAGSCDDSLGDCLDDVAEYLATVDIDGDADNGDQFVTTHTIGFDIDLPILADTAQKSGGRYFMADDVETLALALLNIISEITERSLSFTSPSVSVNTFNRTQNLNDLYLTVFGSRTKVHWPGNLKKFTVADGEIQDADGNAAVNPDTGFFHDTARSIWTVGDADGNDVVLGGAAHQLPDPASRNLYTNDEFNNLDALMPSNADAFTAADFGLTGAAGEPSIEDLIRWMRGQDLRDEDIDGSTVDARNAMGDPLHSQPAAVTYGGSADEPDVVVFAGTNDGYLHAIDGDSGEELWSFVPKELLGDMNRLFFDPTSNFKHYGIDGSIIPIMLDENRNGEIDEDDFVYIVFGMRRGGSSYYALDVTNKNSPELLWVRQYPEFGQSWSTPVITRIDIDDGRLNEHEAVVILGGGYDTVHDTRTHPASPDAQGAGIHMLDLVSGERLWHAGPDESDGNLELSRMTRAIPTQVRAIDLSGDGRVDRMYASDLGGQLWRFDITNGEIPDNLVAGGVIAQLGAEGLGSPTDADTRRFYNAPDVAIFNDPFQGRRFISVSIGSGYRAHPLDNTIADKFYSIRDPDVFNQLTQDEYNAYDIITEATLEDVQGEVRVVLDQDDDGWMFTLPAEQKVISDSVTFNDTVFFVGFSPEENLSDPCQPSTGRNFLYEVSIVNGDPIVNNLDALLAEDADAERVTELAQGGIAPSPAFLFPGPEDPECEGSECAPPIGCVGVECFNPGFVNNPVRTLWTQDGVE